VVLSRNKRISHLIVLKIGNMKIWNDGLSQRAEKGNRSFVLLQKNTFQTWPLWTTYWYHLWATHKHMIPLLFQCHWLSAQKISLCLALFFKIWKSLSSPKVRNSVALTLTSHTGLAHFVHQKCYIPPKEGPT
jgi:hypothetical protein